MPRLSHQTPKYRKHKASGQAFVELNSHRHYLGPHGTKASKIEYDRLIAEWLINNRQSVNRDCGPTVGELILQFWQDALRHYVKNGEPTSEQAAIKAALRPVRELYGRQPASEFGPLALEAVRNRMIGYGWGRGNINSEVNRVRRLFRWGVRKQLIPPSVVQGLEAVPGLRRGQSEAKENSPILPVDDEIVEATLSHLPDVVADMVCLQRLTGCRPAEVCMMRPCDLDRSAEVWTYRPEGHKTEHHGKERIILLGPKSQVILLSYLARDEQMHCFRPCDSEEKRRAKATANRRTPASCGNTVGTNRKRQPKRSAGQTYTSDS
jgi:integrase